MKTKELILGKSYRIKSKEWFDKNKNENNEVFQDGVKFYKSNHCGESMVLHSFDKYHSHEGEVEMNYSTATWKWNKVFIPPFALEVDPADKRKLSKEIFELAEKIKSYKYIYSSRNATGAGRGRLREMKNASVIVGFDYQGNECIQLPGGDESIPIKWTIEQVRDLIKNKKIELTWDATQYTSITDEVVLGDIQEDMPRNFEWCS